MRKCRWQDKLINGKVIPAKVFKAICNIIFQSAVEGKTIEYGEITNIINKQFPDVKIDNHTDMGHILGEINDQVAKATETSKENPTSIYPSSIVVKKDYPSIVVKKGEGKPGKGFWGVNSGDNPPSEFKDKSEDEQEKALKKYRKNVFDTSKWDCECEETS